MLKKIETRSLSARQTWAQSIRAKYARSVEAVIEVGREIIDAKAALPHGEFEAMVCRDLPFKERAARMYMAVARNKRLLDLEVRPILPTALTTLHAIAQLDQDVFDAMLADGVISAEKTHQDIALASDLYTVRLRGEREKPELQPPAKVLVLPEASKTNPPVPEVANVAPVVDRTLQHDAPALIGEYIPAQAAAPAEERARIGITIDDRAITGPRKYQNQAQLLKAARKMLDLSADGKRVDQVAALEWVAAYDVMEIERRLG